MRFTDVRPRTFISRVPLLVVLFTLLPLASARQHKKDDERLRAKQPTTVTVYGQQDRVTPNEAPQSQKDAARTGGMKGAAARTWNGLISFGGWLLNTNDDIPSE